MRRVLVVANETAVGTHITARLNGLAGSGPLSVFLLVPMSASGSTDPTGKALSAFDRSNQSLQAGLAAIAKMGIEVDGALGPSDPMAAVREVIDRQRIEVILVSTHPLGPSRWLAMDLPHRLARKYDTRLVEHLVAPADVPAAAPILADKSVLEVLLVEDNPDDIELAREALDSFDIEINTTVARDGAQALQYLRVMRPLPDLVLLDLKMPVVDGHAVLRKLADDLGIDALSQLYIAVVTSSPAEKDRLEAHALGARAYIVKTPDFEAFEATLWSVVREIASAS